MVIFSDGMIYEVIVVGEEFVKDLVVLKIEVFCNKLMLILVGGLSNLWVG